MDYSLRQIQYKHGVCSLKADKNETTIFYGILIFWKLMEMSFGLNVVLNVSGTQFPKQGVMKMLKKLQIYISASPCKCYIQHYWNALFTNGSASWFITGSNQSTYGIQPQDIAQSLVSSLFL